MNPSVEAHTIHLENQRVFIVSHKGEGSVDVGRIQGSDLERYFKRPHKFQNTLFLDYFESVRIYKDRNLPKRLNESSAVLKDRGFLVKLVVEREEGDEAVSRMRFVHPSNVELFALRLNLYHRPVTYFADALRSEGATHSSYVSAARALGLYRYNNENEVSFAEAVKMRATPFLLRYLLVSLYQSGADPEKLLKRFETVLASDIHMDGSSRQYRHEEGKTAKRRELLRSLFRISDQHGEQMLREHPCFAEAPRLVKISRSTELDRLREATKAFCSDA